MKEDRRREAAGFTLRWAEVPLPPEALRNSHGSQAPFGLWVIDDPDALIDEMTQDEFERTDERMPYFGMIWPSAESLVTKILRGPRLDGQQVLDLGCGLGLCGFAAARQGAQVTFFDWEPRALEIVAASAEEQGLPLETFTFQVGDWRQPPTFGPFDLILGADVLYERRNGPAVAAFLSRHLKPAAEAWITDPGRSQAEAFPALARQEELDLLSSELLPPQAHNTPITLLRVRRAR